MRPLFIANDLNLAGLESLWKDSALSAVEDGGR